MARFIRFTFLVDKDERAMIDRLGKQLDRSPSDAVRYAVMQLSKQLSAEDPSVYEVDITKKYMLRVPPNVCAGEIDRIRDALEQWRDNDQPFLIINSEVELVKVD